MAEEDPRYDHEVIIEAGDYAQLTYNMIQIETGFIAYYDTKDGVWALDSKVAAKYIPAGKANEFSDVVIYDR